MPQVEALNLSFGHIAPELILMGVALLVTVVDAFFTRPSAGHRAFYLTLSVAACVAAAAVARATLWDVSEASFGGMFIVDRLAIVFKLVVLVGAALSLCTSNRWLSHHEQTPGPFFALVLLSVTGMLLLISSANIVLLFLGLELMSIPAYVLTAADRDKQDSVEAGMKYLLMGSFASGVLLFGLSLLCGWAGTTSLLSLADALNAGAMPPYAVAGGLLFLVGLVFKVGAVPFHMWTPDVYEGAPTPVTIFMATAVKVAMFGVLVRFVGGDVLENVSLNTFLAVVAGLSMVVGNVAALAQNNVKRMLSYSSIAHAGYMLLGLMAVSWSGESAVAFYGLAYTLMTVASFGVLVVASESGSGPLTFADLAGLGRRRPWAALIMTVAMLSLIGLPPTMGFIGKFYIFRAAVQAGYVGLAVLGVLTSAVSLGYYLRVVLVMWFDEPESPATKVPHGGLAMACALGISTALLLVLGVFPSPVLELVLHVTSP